MLNWNTEKASQNYCGYCTGYSSSCSGSCFDEPNNKLKHLLSEIKFTKQRLSDLEKELVNVKTEVYTQMQNDASSAEAIDYYNNNTLDLI
jgi:hypothetical protein